MAKWTREKVYEYCDELVKRSIKEKRELEENRKRKERADKIKILFE